jgi:hypothetical protein
VFGYREPEQLVARLRALVPEVLPRLTRFYRELGWTFDMWLAASLPTEMPEGTWQLEMRFAGLSAEQRAIFDELYGGPQMRVYLRPVGSRVVVATGPDAGELMREWVGRLEAAGPPRPPGAVVPGRSRLALGFVDVPAYLRMGLGLPDSDPGPAWNALLSALGPRQDLWIEATTDGRSVHLELRYPLEATLRALRAAQP